MCCGRAAGRLKSQATTTVSIAYAPMRFGAGGKMSVGRPNPNMIDSALVRPNAELDDCKTACKKEEKFLLSWIKYRPWGIL